MELGREEDANPTPKASAGADKLTGSGWIASASRRWHGNFIGIVWLPAGASRRDYDNTVSSLRRLLVSAAVQCIFALNDCMLEGLPYALLPERLLYGLHGRRMVVGEKSHCRSSRGAGEQVSSMLE